MEKHRGLRSVLNARRIQALALSLGVLVVVSATAVPGEAEAAPLDQSSKLGSNTVFSAVAARNRKIIAVGTTDNCAPSRISCPTTSTSVVLARYKRSGKLDKGFGRSGWVVMPPLSPRLRLSLTGLALRPDGSIVVSMVKSPSPFDGVVMSFTKDGRRDPTFGRRGMVTIPNNQFQPSFDRRALVALPKGAILLAGTSQEGDHDAFTLMRLDRHGDRDLTFGINGLAKVDFGYASSSGGTLDLQRDGTLLALATVTRASVNPEAAPAVASVKPDGSLDPSFGSNGVTAVFDGYPPSGPVSVGRWRGGQVFFGSAGSGHSICGTGFQLTSLQSNGSYPGSLFESGPSTATSPQGCSDMSDVRPIRSGLVAVGATDDPERAVSVVYRAGKGGRLEGPSVHRISPPQFNAWASGQVSIGRGRTAVAGFLDSARCDPPYRPARRERCRIATLTLLSASGRPIKSFGRHGRATFPPGRISRGLYR